MSAENGEGTTQVDTEVKEEKQPVVDDSNDPPYFQRSKKRFIILFGYIGLNYHGLQINPGVPTIEEELEKAISGSGVVKDENVGNLQKSNWSRAARTDKGVHALGQIVTLKLCLKEDQASIDAFKAKLQSLLPSDIWIFDVIRSTKSFNAKNQCSSRLYEYLLPTFLLSPLPPRSNTDSKSDETGESTGGEGVEEEQQEDEDAQENNEDGKSKTDDGESQVTERKSVQYRDELIKHFRPSGEVLEHFRTVMERYLGTHKFHNFTPKVTASQMSSLRYMMNITVSDPFELQGVQVVRISIEGQSFMLNQIRKMVGTAVELTRRGMPPETLDIFFQDERRPTPMIPGEGLLLRACIYLPYNQRYAIGYEDHPAGASTKVRYPPVDFLQGDIKKRCEEVRDKYIYPAVIDQEMKRNVFATWLWRHNHVRFPANPLPERTDTAKRKQAAKDEKVPKRHRFETADAELKRFLDATVDHTLS